MGSQMFKTFLLGHLLFIALLGLAFAAPNVCPLTLKAPHVPSVPYKRCISASNLSCCEDCSDYRFALIAVSANGTALLGSLAPGMLDTLGSAFDFPVCSLFVNYNECQLLLEDLECGIQCDSDSYEYVVADPKYVGTEFANGTVNVCSAFAQRLYDSCKDIPVPNFGGTLANFFTNRNEFIDALLGSLVSASTNGQTSFSSTIVNGTEGCFNGSKGPLPTVTACCDNFDIPSSCPAGAVNVTEYPQFKQYLHRNATSRACPASPPPALSLSPPSPASAPSSATSNSSGPTYASSAPSSPSPAPAPSSAGESYSWSALEQWMIVIIPLVVFSLRI